MFPQSLNTWYDRFGLSAVLSDILVIAIGFAIARWIFSTWFAGRGLWVFLAILVAVQAIHDFLFYVGVILPLPRGANAMMDVFKTYATEGSGGIIFGDALLMLGSAAVFLVLEQQSVPVQWSWSLLVTYALPYILTTASV